MAAIVNARDALLQAAAIRYVPPELPGTIDFANVTGATRPADNATKNSVTYSASAPPSPTNGDIWVDTSVTPNVQKLRVAGAWQVGANLTTNTNQLIDGASLGSTAAWSGVSGSGKPADNADQTQPTLNAGVTLTAGGLTLSSGGAVKGGKSDYAAGTAGFFLGHSGGSYKFDIGDPTKYLRWTGAALNIVGDIVGASTLDITGAAVFKGTSAGYAEKAAVYAEATDVLTHAIFGESAHRCGVFGVSGTQNGVFGRTASGSYAAVHGYNNGGGVGVYGQSGGGSAVLGHNTGSGPSVECVTKFKWGSFTYAIPDGSTKLLRADGTWTSNYLSSSGWSLGTGTPTHVFQIVVAGSTLNIPVWIT
jgi:hypothetical protein